MSAHDDHAERKRVAAASAIDSLDHHYGRRVETDRSWTVYHVFTGVPAHVGDIAMIGMSRRAATEGMLSLNRRNELRREMRTS